MKFEPTMDQAIEIKRILKEFFIFMYENGLEETTLRRNGKELEVTFNTHTDNDADNAA